MPNFVSEVPYTLLILKIYLFLVFQFGDFHYFVYHVADLFFCLIFAIDIL